MKMNTKTLTYENIKVIIDLDSRGEDLKSGDKYVGMWSQYCADLTKYWHDCPPNNFILKHNLMYPDGYPLLTCKNVDKERGYIIPEEPGYYFDLCDCRKVVEIITE